MNLKQLEYFVRVAELGSFSKAALVLNIAQPALSRQVRLLETDLHVTLLTRTGRGVVLTEPGKRLFDHSVVILQLVARATEDIEAARDVPSGRIVIGLPPSMGRLLTLPLVESFRRTLPQARLVIVEGLSAHLTEWIATGRIDLALVLNPEPNPAIEVTPLLDEPLGLVGPAKPSKAARSASAGKNEQAPIAFSELTAYRLILPERSHVLRRLLETHAAQVSMKLDVDIEVSSVQSILELVTAGYGHAVLSRTALRASGRPAAFAFRPLVKPAIDSKFFLAVSAHKPATPLGRVAFRMLQELMLATAAQSIEAASRSHIKTR